MTDNEIKKELETNFSSIFNYNGPFMAENDVVVAKDAVKKFMAGKISTEDFAQAFANSILYPQTPPAVDTPE